MIARVASRADPTLRTQIFRVAAASRQMGTMTAPTSGDCDSVDRATPNTPLITSEQAPGFHPVGHDILRFRKAEQASET